MVFQVRMERLLENQPPVLHPWLLGLRTEAEKVGMQKHPPFQGMDPGCAPALQQELRDAAKQHSWLQLFIFPEQCCLHRLHECKST